MQLFDIKKIPGAKINTEEAIVLAKKKIEELLKQVGYQIEEVNNVAYSYIKNEIEYRNENYEGFGMDRKLNEFEISEIAERIDDMENLFCDVLETIDEEIHTQLKVI